MKKQKLILISALSLAASLALAPIGFASEPSSTPNTLNATGSNQSVAPSLTTSAYPDVAGPFPVGGSSPLLFLHGDFEVVINPAQYANFTITIYDNMNNPISNMSYSGSSPTTLHKSAEYLRGYHTIKVTSNLPLSAGGTFSVNY